MHSIVAFTMIQRIQTVYLIIVALLMVALYIWFPVLQNEANEIVLDRSALWIMIPVFVSIGLAIISILNFKKRQLQFVINRLNIILNFVLLGVFVYRSLSVSGETFVSVKGIGVLIPVISIVFLVLANKAIKRDEDLVKSVDRLR